jgi:hypothetical protein
VSGLRRSVSFGGGRVMILKNELVLNDEKFSIWMSMLICMYLTSILNSCPNICRRQDCTDNT